MENWKIEKIGTFATIGRGASPRPITDKKYFVDGNIPWIKIADATASGRVINETKEYVNEYGASFSRLLKKGSLIMSASGVSLGIPRFLGIDGCIHDGWLYLENFHNIDINFLYYKLLTLQSYFLNLSYGAAIQNINTNIFSKTKILIPPLQIQQKIANILSRYDEAIENNNKRIKLLEQMAQNLYKEWFVRFRFPGWQNTEFEKSSIGKIPTSFKVIKQNEIISDYIGGGWGEDEESSNFPIQAAVVRGADFPEFTKGDISTCPIRFHKKSNYESRIIEEDDIVLEVSGGTQEQPVGRTVIITKERLERFDNKLICASFCKLIRLNKKVIAPFFYYYWMQFVYNTRMIDRYQLQSTGIINFKFEYFLRKGDVLLPPAELMWEFDSKVRTIHKQIENLAIANENLTKQRDLLLPRLMSGKLEMKQLWKKM